MFFCFNPQSFEQLKSWKFEYKSLPCLSGSALRDTKALTAGNVMLDMAATAPAAHIILNDNKYNISINDNRFWTWWTLNRSDSLFLNQRIVL